MTSPGGFLGGPGVVQVIPAIAIETFTRSSSRRDRGSKVNGQQCVGFVPTPEPGKTLKPSAPAPIFAPLNGAGLGAKDPAPASHLSEAGEKGRMLRRTPC